MPMDKRLQKAAVTGDVKLMMDLVSDSGDPDVLLGRTPQGNTCLHISAIHGHQVFCTDAVGLNKSLLDLVNADGETPLLTAAARGRGTLASVLLGRCRVHPQRSETIKRQDVNGCNALHHAIRSGRWKLALELIEAEPALSEAVNGRGESPMFIAAMRNFEHVLDQLLEIPDSSHSGGCTFNVLHAAVKNGNSAVAKKVIEKRPFLARELNGKKHTPVHLAAHENKVDVLTVFLEHDPSLGYLISTGTDGGGSPLLVIAASQGNVGVARELLKHCPDAPYRDEDGNTCLHVAVASGQTKFVEFVLGSQELQHLINMVNKNGKTALHLAAITRHMGMLDAFMLHQDKDEAVIDNAGNHARALMEMAEDAGSTSSLEGATTDSSRQSVIDTDLLEAATTGNSTIIRQRPAPDPAVLLGTTPRGNTCLHIACIHGHEIFCRDVLTLNQSLSLLTAINADGETPLLTAVIRGRTTLASVLLNWCSDRNLTKTILKQDKHGCNVLHYAIRSGHKKLALELIDAEPALSNAVNKCNDSPMFMAVMRDYVDVFEKLLSIDDSAHAGEFGNNVLHAAVRNGNSVITKRVMETRPWLVRQENKYKYSPIHLAANGNKIDMLAVLLKHDRSLGYLISNDGAPLLCITASKGHVGAARELLKHCPDAPYCNANGSTCLHVAVSSGQAEFVQFILSCQHLQHLINVADNSRDTAMSVASKSGEPEKAAALQFHLDLSIRAEPFTSGMDKRLLKAAASGDVAKLNDLAQHDDGVLLGTTPQKNTCLHVASTHGHQAFCTQAQTKNPSLLEAVNSDGETPLLAAVANSHVSVASDLLTFCLNRRLREAILKQDKRGCNVLHHAIRSGHTPFALRLIREEPALSRAVNQYGESPMFIAVMRNFVDILEKLLAIPDSAHQGACGFNALHAAVRNDNSDIAQKIMAARPDIAREENKDNSTPMMLAVLWNKISVLRILLEHDRSLGYVVCSKYGNPLILGASSRGNVGIAEELLESCPEAPYCNRDGWTCLHQAINLDHMEFVQFVLAKRQLRRLVNIRNSNGDTPLHVAVQKCKPKMVAALLLHKDIDITVLNNKGQHPLWCAGPAADAKTLNWNEVFMLMLNADPRYASSILNLYKEVMNKVTDLSREDIKSLTQKYTGRTSVVATLIASSTFAAAFTMSKGYNTDAGNVGSPTKGRTKAFEAFLTFDVLAMCSSLAVAFICIIARWEDLDFLLYYMSFTRKLMWFAYMATTMAFATGLYTVLAPRLLWLAVAICVLASLLPILTKFLGEWPVMKLRIRLGRTFKSELLDMV